MRYIKNFIPLILLLISSPAFSQISIHFIPEIYGNSLNGLLSAKIFNASGTKTVRLKITITEAKAGKVVVVQTSPFTLMQGNNILPASAIRTAQLSIATNQIGNYIQRNQYFPQGNYEYEFELFSISTNTQLIANQVFNKEIVPPAPLTLIQPYNTDQICEKRPVLSWMPSIPQALDMLYELLLVEIKENQNKTEALNYNIPIVNQKSIVATTLLYPPVSKELVEGKKYAWQVTAYKDQTVINRSEVWEFKVECKDTVATIVETDFGYRDIEDLSKGNYYMAEGMIKFAMMNPYTEHKLKYQINCITNSKLKVRGLPSLKLKKGINKINLDLSHNFSLKDGYSYIMKAYLPNGTSMSLRFIYRESK